MDECAVIGCDFTVKSRGLCNRHYHRHKTHGDVPILPKRTVADRIDARTDKTGDCWLWTGYTNDDGYGIIKVNGRAVGVHRVAYELVAGPIPKGIELDHLCQVRHCVRPGHLEPVTHTENVRRSGVRTTHCPSGHLYDEANTYVYRSGARGCRACGRVGGRSPERKGIRSGDR